MTSQYLPLTEYSSKYKVSISTLRRRIKADEIKYVFEDGKYLILDNGTVHKASSTLGTNSRNVHRPSQKSEETDATIGKSNKVPAPSVKQKIVTERGTSADSVSPFLKSPTAPSDVTEWNEEFSGFDARDRQEPILTAANRLLTELKKAYAQVLQEKEEQILLLREEVSDLKTLVRALESEHSKSRKK